jgi:hypothetical protein
MFCFEPLRAQSVSTVVFVELEDRCLKLCLPSFHLSILPLYLISEGLHEQFSLETQIDHYEHKASMIALQKANSRHRNIMLFSRPAQLSPTQVSKIKPSSQYPPVVARNSLSSTRLKRAEKATPQLSRVTNPSVAANCSKENI